MAVAEMARAIGRRGLYDLGNGMKVGVIVRDVRPMFGRIDYQIEPRSGEGMVWVECSKVMLEDEK